MKVDPSAIVAAFHRLGKLEKRLNQTVAQSNTNQAQIVDKLRETRAMLPQLARTAVAELVDRGTAKTISSHVATEHVEAATEKADTEIAQAAKYFRAEHDEIHEAIGRAFGKIYDELLDALAFAEGLLAQPNHPKAGQWRRDAAKYATWLRGFENMPTMAKVAELLEHPKKFNRDVLIDEFWNDRAAHYRENDKLRSESDDALAEARKEMIAKARAEVEFG